MNLKYTNSVETLIIFGTYKRREICLKSLGSLISAIEGYDVKLIVSDGTPDKPLDNDSFNNKINDYIWTPKFTNMAISRNLAERLARDKYIYEWIMFLEDDLIFESNWYPELLGFASKVVDKESPFGMPYGLFSATPNATKKDDTTLYDSNFDCYAGLFGIRADQRLYKSSHYNNIGVMWDSDILPISSCQTGKVLHRSLMRGYVSGEIGHRKLCQTLDEKNENSTWINKRDIGPAAFDKRIDGYKSIKLTANQYYSESHKLNKLETNIRKTYNLQTDFIEVKPQTKKTMTSVIPGEKIILKKILKRFYRAFNLILTGRY